MPSHIVWAIVWALPVMVAILAIPFYMRFVRKLSVMQAIAGPLAVIVVATVVLVAPLLWAILTSRYRP
jgi:hypothetical protein